MERHLVRVHLPYRSDEDLEKWIELEDHMDAEAQKAGVGSLDGNEVGQGEFTIWLQGDDGMRLAEVTREALTEWQLPPECYIFVRHGGLNNKNSREEIIPLNEG